MTPKCECMAVWKSYVLRNRVHSKEPRKESRFFRVHFLPRDTRGVEFCTNDRVVCGVEFEFDDISYGCLDTVRVECMGSLDTI